MPNFNGTGPNGAGSMTGRGLGRCGGTRAFDAPAGTRGYGRGEGFGRGCGGGRGGNRGHGRGMGYGPGRGLGWMAMGYGGAAPTATVKSALEERKAFLSAELARTEALLSEGPARESAATDGDAEK